MASCFHGNTKDQCFFCGVIRSQALGMIEHPCQPTSIVEAVADRLRRWIFFWRPKTGLTVRAYLKQEAQRVALAEDLVAEEEFQVVRYTDLLIDEAASTEPVPEPVPEPVLDPEPEPEITLEEIDATIEAALGGVILSEDDWNELEAR